MESVDASDLRVFEAVARLGAMNRAAAELNTVQSNVTGRIRGLERELGAPLFERHSRGVTLTAAGHRLLPFARRMGQLLEDARRAVEDDGHPKGLLTLGSLETTAAIRLSPLLSTYAAAYPEVDLVLRTGTTAELIEAVLEHRVEGAFVCGPVDNPALEQETVFEERLALATAPDVPAPEALAGRDTVKIVVLRAGCSYRQRLEEILARRGIVGLRRLEFGTLDSILGCVAAGLGVTLLPARILEAPRRDGRIAVHPIAPAEAHADTLFIRRRNAYRSHAIEAFLEQARGTALPAVAE